MPCGGFEKPGLQAGDWVLSFAGWQDYTLSDRSDLTALGKSPAHPSYAWGIFGMPGLTAYMGLLDIGRPQAGETLVVAAAAGPVGATVGRIGKIKGKANASCVGTLVERTSGYLMLVKMNDATATSAMEGFSAALNGMLLAMRKSMTYDQGREMARHAEITQQTGVADLLLRPAQPLAAR